MLLGGEVGKGVACLLQAFDVVLQCTFDFSLAPIQPIPMLIVFHLHFCLRPISCYILDCKGMLFFIPLGRHTGEW